MNDRSLEPSRTWYVVRCKQYRERLASANLGAQGFEPYLPMLLTKRKRLGIWSSVEAEKMLFVPMALTSRAE